MHQRKVLERDSLEHRVEGGKAISHQPGQSRGPRIRLWPSACKWRAWLKGQTMSRAAAMEEGGFSHLEGRGVTKGQIG